MLSSGNNYLIWRLANLRRLWVDKWYNEGFKDFVSVSTLNKTINIIFINKCKSTEQGCELNILYNSSKKFCTVHNELEIWYIRI